METISLSVLRTRLYRPVAGGVVVRRQRLIDALDQGRDLPLTLVSAPAGSGKTTLLCDWLATCPDPNAWLSLDEGDGDLRVFLSYFVAAVQSVFPGACRELQTLLQASDLPPRHALATVAINELDALRDHDAMPAGRHFVLVLDDYHLARSQGVDFLLAELMRHPPPSLRLILLSRSDPALPLSVMRARKQVLEIRFQDLRFTSDEAATFLQQSLGSPVAADVLSLLEEKTEGWITGLYLASLYARHAQDPGLVLGDLEFGDRYVMDYLVDQVLSRQSPAVQDFLLMTSVLDRLCAPLVEVVAGLSDPICNGQAYLEWLERSNMFVVSLDNRQQWFRYHHLFQELLLNRLRRRLTDAEIAALHSRASAWYAENNLVDEAIVHALTAGDEMAAVDLVESHRQEAMNREQWQLLERWLGLLPKRLLDRRPELLILEAWILQRQWRLVDMAPYLKRVEALLDTGGFPDTEVASWRAEIDALRSVTTYYGLDGKRTLALASRALKTLPMTHSSARGLAWMYYGAGYQMLGDIPGARRVLMEGLKEDRFHGNAFPARPLLSLCILDWMTADLSDLRQTATHLLSLADERNLAESVAWAHYFKGCAAYQLNDLEEADREFASVVGQRYVAHSFPYSQSAFGLASVYLAQGADDRARAIAESVVTYALEIKNTRVLGDAVAFQAWLALKQGRYAEARRWAETIDSRAALVPLTTFHVAAITLAKVLLERKTSPSIREGTELVARLHTFAKSQHNTRYLIEILALQALVQNASGRDIDALRTLAEAIELAQPGGVVRAFVDLGPALATLLRRLRMEGSAAAFVAQVIQAFSPSENPAAFGATQVAPRLNLVDPLSVHEVEILSLLARRQSAKEIAQQLVISDRTVKRHTANIYQKLGVNSRQQAVSAAEALGILHSPARPPD